ncbi:toxin-antitoxin system HicB family antitoxin [Methylobacterium planeticum]|uniref:Toxin-antitoxin system HicB family antitoxin n=1 Tax=Methylobacterium planeticum TaxID=2615211 RepID=A0A6N6MGB7_9HYPH|nr:toxin-antitoxin system HicB family antitoxin [Methylobacterium planeticum]
MSASKGSRKRYTLRLPRSLHMRLGAAAEVAGLPLNDFIVRRLGECADSSTAAARSGCAGNGEGAEPSSPDLAA